MNKCKCTPDETTGWTEVKCCNICGKPVEEFWSVSESELLAVYESILIKMMSEEIPTYNMQEGEIIKQIVSKIVKIKRHL